MSFDLIRIGTAGWSIPATEAAAFPGEGTHLGRYAARLSAAEINSSFYRSHRPSTYERWADSVPARFRFAVKVPRTITHERRLADCGELLAGFLAEVGHLGSRLGPLLVQLPPSLRFDPDVVSRFFDLFRTRFDGPLACEPRHPSWFEPEAGRLLEHAHVARVAADPAPAEGAGEPGGWPGLRYYRFHGSPRIYYSDYSQVWLNELADSLAAQRESGTAVWCIFDNTALGHALGNAMSLQDLIKQDLTSNGHD